MSSTNPAIIRTHHVCGLVTSSIHATPPSKPKQQKTEEQLQEDVEHHIFWNDRKHENEEWS